MKTENTIPDTIPAPLADALARMMREIDEAFAAPPQPFGASSIHQCTGGGFQVC
jgi:hypothetical protein